VVKKKAVDAGFMMYSCHHVVAAAYLSYLWEG